MIPSVILAYLSARLSITHDDVGWQLLAMALLYPASAVIVLRRFGRRLLPGVAVAALVAYALPLAAGIAALPLDRRVLIATLLVALTQTVLPIGLATTTIWHLERRDRRPAAALHLAAGVTAYLAGIPLALLAGAVATLALSLG